MLCAVHPSQAHYLSRGPVSTEVIALMALALPQPDGSSVNEFSVLADKPVVLIREFFFDASPSLDDLAALCPQFTYELGESFPVIPRLHGYQGILFRYFWISRGHLDRDG